MGSTGWRVVVEEPLADIIVPILRFTSVLPALVAMAGILSLIVIYFSVRTIVRPLAAPVGEGHADHRRRVWADLEQDVGGVEEIRQLHHALRDMVERIRRYQESMRDYIEGITQGQETERARLSRELHDETVQALVAIGQRTQLAQRALERGDGPAGDRGTAADSRAVPAGAGRAPSHHPRPAAHLPGGTGLSAGAGGPGSRMRASRA